MDFRACSTRRQASLLRQLLAHGNICGACWRATQRRHLSVDAAAVQPQSPPPPPPPPTEPTASHEHTATTEPQASAATESLLYHVKAGILLTRAPLLTRELTPFEKAFFLYQRRLNERLALPFTRYFYFKKGTPADTEWKRKVRERQTAARDIGVYNAYSREGWNDEVLVGAPESEPEHQVEALIRDAESAGPGPGAGQGEEGIGERKREAIPRPNPRVTEADRTGDVSSLNRRLDRTLYLLARQGDNKRWRFPESPLMRLESLQQAAERLVVQTGGINMNTWVVGNAPVGHHSMLYRQPPVIAPTGLPTRGEKTFFMKVRILAGYPRLEDNELGLTELRWLCKEEIQPIVSPGYWKFIRGMLADR